MTSRALLLALLAALAALPQGLAVAPPLDNDGGRGADAPSAPDASFLVPANVVLEGASNVATDSVDVYAFEAEAGDAVQARVRGSVGCYDLLDPDGAVVTTLGCSYGEAMDLSDPPVTLGRSGVWFLQLAQISAGPYRFTIGLNAAAQDVSLLAPVTGQSPLVPGSDPTCGTGAPVTATQGAGDAALPTLAYAALKTGFRAVVAWETATPGVATLTASLDGGATVTLTERFARTQHVFVLDDLPEGRTLCFTPQGGGAHALRLANAMNAHDGTAYLLNLLVLANEQPDRAALEAGLARFAGTMWDATDGHLRVGRVVTIYGDLEHHNSGWATCYIPSVLTGDRPLCENVYDVLFTHDGSQGGAAQTYADAIRDPQRAIWMNQHMQAPFVGLPDDAGRVLAHEMGHYAFGAQDLYGSLAGTDPDCWDPAKGLSVMGGSRDATEFDDEANRCPNESILVDYVPTWTLFRQDFPLVPARTVINAGPAGDGGAYALSAFRVGPLASELVSTDVQDDAGSGRDAGESRETAVPIQPGVVYTATGLGPAPDLIDAYVFHGVAGQSFEGWSDGNVGCYTLFAPDGAELGNGCSYAGAPINTGPLAVTLPATGQYMLEIAQLSPAVYRFAFALDAPAPDVRLVPAGI